MCDYHERPAPEIRPGVQQILLSLRLGGDILNQVLNNLAFTDREFKECWLDVRQTLEILASGDDPWPESKKYFALFQKAFPVIWPIEYVKWMAERHPAEALAFWQVLRR